MSIPNKEQMLYSQLVIVHSLAEYILDNCDDTIFDDDALLASLHDVVECSDNSQYLMKCLFKKQSEKKRVCY